MAIILERSEYTPWKILLTDGFEDVDIKNSDEININEYEYCFKGYKPYYRTSFKDGRACEVFSLIPMNTTYCTLQLYIYKDGTVTYFSYMPVEVVIQKRNHIIQINVFAAVETLEDSNGVSLKFYPVDNSCFVPFVMPI